MSLARRLAWRASRACDDLAWEAVVSRHYGLANAYRSAQFRVAARKRKPIVLVHQMGKVGSSTVARSLKKRGLDAHVYFTHHLHPDTRRTVEAVFERYFRVTGKARVGNHVLTARHLRDRLDRGDTGPGRWKVVTLVRDPVARNVAAFFQAFPVYFPEHGPRFHLDERNVPELTRLFLEEFEFENSFPLRWFDRDVRDVFGIDVFSVAFPRSRGYRIYEGEDVDLLLLRLEDLDRCAASAFADYLGLDDFRLVNANLSGDKDYDAAYRRFKRSIRLPAAYLDRMYGCRLARHFYSEEELSRFRARWNDERERGAPASAEGR